VIYGMVKKIYKEELEDKTERVVAVPERKKE
jgi:hypothetical protein